MNNIKEDIEKIINNHLMKDTAYTLMSNGLKSELETYINKVREEAVVKAFNFIQSEVEVPCVTTTDDTNKNKVIWAKANGFVDAVTLLDEKVKEYLQSIKEKK